MSRVRLLEIGLGLFFIAVIGTLLLGYVPLSHQRLTAMATTVIKKQGLDSCSLGMVRVTVWKGVSFQGVSLAGKTSSGSYRASADGITLRCNLFMVAVKHNAIRAIIEKEFRQAASQKKQQDPLSAVRSALRVAAVSGYVKGMKISHAQVTLQGRATPLVQIRDAGTNLSFHLSGSERVTGNVTLGMLELSGREIVSQAESGLTYDSGTVTIADFRARSFGGKVKGEARFNLESGTLFSAQVTGTGIDCNAIGRLGDTTGRISGKAALKFAFDSSALTADSLRGKGTISITRFEIAGYPFQRSLETMLLYKGLGHLRFDKFSSTVALRPKLIFENSAVGEGDTLTAKADGWIRADGLLNQKLDCTLSRAGVKTLPEFAQKTLEEGPQGSRVLRCRIYGMIQNPKVSVESKVILQRAVKNMFEDVRNNLQLWMR